MRRRWRALATVGLTVAAIGVASTALAGPTRPEPRPADDERWRITGRPSTDGCGGRVVLAARHLRMRGSTMFADVVNRTYALERRGTHRVAEGRFDEEYACPGTRIHERWELAQVSDDVLEGSLESTWRLRPACEPCTIRFRIRAVRVRR